MKKLEDPVRLSLQKAIINSRIFLAKSKSFLSWQKVSIFESSFMLKPKDRCYFNVEITHSKKTLVINASKSGLDDFLHTYGSDQPPQEIPLKAISRPQRCWTSWKLTKNPQALPTDPTCYMAQFQEGSSNTLADMLRIQLNEQNSQERVFYASLDGMVPVLVVNAEGWQLFLRMLATLRDKRDWFMSHDQMVKLGNISRFN